VVDAEPIAHRNDITNTYKNTDTNTDAHTFKYPVAFQHPK